MKCHRMKKNDDETSWTEIENFQCLSDRYYMITRMLEFYVRNGGRIYTSGDSRARESGLPSRVYWPVEEWPVNFLNLVC